MAEKTPETEVLKANNQFTKDMYHIISKTPGNIIFSPFGVHTCLSIIYPGSSDTTKDSIAGILKIFDPCQAADGYDLIMNALNNLENVTLLIANKVYLMSGFDLKSKYERIVVNKFHAEIESLDFQHGAVASEKINSWVSSKTKERITKLFKPEELDADTRMVLVNAIYFKSDWAEKFSRDSTLTQPFYIDENTSKDCQMMHNKKKFRYKEDKALEAKVVELPYKNGIFSMIVVLPNDKNGIIDLESKLENYNLEDITNDMDERHVMVGLPKFIMEQEIDLKEFLEKMGLGELFDQKLCKLPEMIEGESHLFVSRAIQKAFIEVNEEGSEAAAATGTKIRRKYAKWEDDSVEFIANHPFLVMIIFKYKNYSTSLYFGKIVEPITNDPFIARRPGESLCQFPLAKCTE